MRAVVYVKGEEAEVFDDVVEIRCDPMEAKRRLTTEENKNTGVVWVSEG